MTPIQQMLLGAASTPPQITTDGLYYFMDANNSNVMSGSSRTLQSYDRIGYVPGSDIGSPSGYAGYLPNGTNDQWQQGQHNSNATSSIYYTAPSGNNTAYFTFDGRPDSGGYGLGVESSDFNAYGKSCSWDGWVRPYGLGNARSNPPSYGTHSTTPIVMAVNKQQYGPGNGSFSATQHWFYVWKYNNTNAWWGVANHDSSGTQHTMTGVMPSPTFNWTTNNDWYHFAITLNGSNGDKRVYIDGGLNMNSTNSSYASVAYTNYQHEARLYIGGAPGNSNQIFKGDISTSRFYNNKVLTAAEVLNNYNLEKSIHGKP